MSRLLFLLLLIPSVAFAEPAAPITITPENAADHGLSVVVAIRPGKPHRVTIERRVPGNGVVKFVRAAVLVLRDPPEIGEESGTGNLRLRANLKPTEAGTLQSKLLRYQFVIAPNFISGAVLELEEIQVLTRPNEPVPMLLFDSSSRFQVPLAGFVREPIPVTE